MPPLYYLKDKDGNLQPVPGYRMEDFEEMVRRRPDSQSPGPPSFTLQSMLLEGTVRDGQAEFKAQFRIQLHSEGWVAVPLRLDQAIVKGSPQYKGSGQQFLQSDAAGGYTCWLRGGGAEGHLLTLDLAAPLTAVGSDTRLKLALPRATVPELKLTVPMAGAVAKVPEGAALVSALKAGDSGTAFHVMGCGGDFELSWRPPTAGPPAAQTVLEATGAMLARIDARGITFEARLTVRGYGGGFDHFRVRLPKGAQYVPGNSSQYSVIPVALGGPTGEDWKVVEVRFPGRTSGPEEVQLSSRLEYDAAGASGWCELAGYEVIGAERQSGLIAVAASGQWQVLLEPGHGVRQLDELPESLRREDLVGGFEYSTQPCSLTARIVPRATRIAVDPEYLFFVEARQVTLQARLKYTVRTARVRTLDVELGPWQFDEVGPENLVKLDAAAVDPTGLLSIRLKQESIGQFELTLRAHRKLPAETKALVLELPRPRADSQFPATVVVLPDDDVELGPASDAMVGLVRQQVAPLMKLPPRQQEPLFFRGEPAKAVFTAAFRVHERSVRVGVASEVRLDEQKAEVHQRLSYAIAYKPLDRFVLELPREQIASDQMEVKLDDGKRLALTDAAEREPAADAAPTVRRQVLLPSPRIGGCELTLRYAVVLDKLQPKASISSTIPLVMPADGELSANRLTVAPNEGIRVQQRSGPWTASENGAQGSRRRGLELSSAARTPELALAIYLDDPNVLGSTVVERAWVQTWLTATLRHERAVFRFTGNQKHVELTVPAGVSPGEVELWLDERRTTGQATPEGRVIVALPAEEGFARHRLEAIYHFPVERPGPGLLALELPRLGRDAWVHRTYWQLVLPPKEHLLAAPAVLTQEFRWGWTGMFWGRQPLLEQPYLEAWAGARHFTELPASANRYLFSAVGPISRCELQTVRRPLVVLAASGLALAVGLLLIYVRALRHPLSLLIAAILLGGALLVYPEPTLLVAQAAGLGIVLALGAGLLHRSVARKRRTEEVSSSILDRGSTQVFERQPVAGSLESTETAPAMSPAPVRDSVA